MSRELHGLRRSFFSHLSEVFGTCDLNLVFGCGFVICAYISSACFGIMVGGGELYGKRLYEVSWCVSVLEIFKGARR